MCIIWILRYLFVKADMNNGCFILERYIWNTFWTKDNNQNKAINLNSVTKGFNVLDEKKWITSATILHRPLFIWMMRWIVHYCYHYYGSCGVRKSLLLRARSLVRQTNESTFRYLHKVSSRHRGFKKILYSI